MWASMCWGCRAHIDREGAVSSQAPVQETAFRVADDLRDEQAEAYPLLHVILRGTRPVDVRRHPVDATSGRYAETPVPSGT